MYLLCRHCNSSCFVEKEALRFPMTEDKPAVGRETVIALCCVACGAVKDCKPKEESPQNDDANKKESLKAKINPKGSGSFSVTVAPLVIPDNPAGFETFADSQRAARRA